MDKPTMTTAELDASSVDDVMDMKDVTITDFPRSAYADRYDLWILTLDEPDVAEAMEPSSKLSDFDLYAGIRVNEVGLAMPMEALESVEEHHLGEFENIAISDFPKEQYQSAYDEWTPTLANDLGRDFVAPTDLTDFQLYRTVRLNRLPLKFDMETLAGLDDLYVPHLREVEITDFPRQDYVAAYDRSVAPFSAHPSEDLSDIQLYVAVRTEGVTVAPAPAPTI